MDKTQDKIFKQRAGLYDTRIVGAILPYRDSGDIRAVVHQRCMSTARFILLCAAV